MKKSGAEKNRCNMIFTANVVINKPIPVPDGRIRFSAKVVGEQPAPPQKGNVIFNAYVTHGHIHSKD